MSDTKPAVWKMVKEAVDHFNGTISYDQIKNFIYNKWGNVNPATINDQIHVLTVNLKARVSHSYNEWPRLTNSNSPYDYLFNLGPGKVEKYVPERHGIWEIYFSEDKSLNVRQVNSKNKNCYLFVWNPKKWPWEDLNNKIEQLNHTGKTSELWSCKSHKQIKPGDRAFFVKVGSHPSGIFASGYITSEPFKSKHWSGADKEVYRVVIDFEFLLNSRTESILTIDLIRTSGLVNQDWTPQASGISIHSEIVPKLEVLWFNFLNDHYGNIDAGDENELDAEFIEGTSYEVKQTRYERNPHARQECLNHYGYCCTVCTMDFVSRYGVLGKDFIHVHHLRLLSSRTGKHKVDPITDLRPVCPNCHAMLHRKNPPLAIDELKSRLRS